VAIGSDRIAGQASASTGVNMLKETTVQVPGWKVNATVLRGGSGQPFVWLHGMEEPSKEDPLLIALSEHFEVFAPIHPGFRDLHELHDLRDVHDLSFYHDELLEALHLERAAVGGVSFGAMVAAELAAHVPNRVDHLVLAAPMGLWRDDEPAADPFTAYSSGGLTELLWSDPYSSDAARSIEAFSILHGGADSETDATSTMMIGMVQGLTTVGKFIWPLPDKGLRRRLHRISASTLVLWGSKDRLVPMSYAQEFSSRMRDARVVLLDAGHMAPYEKIDEFVGIVSDHLMSHAGDSGSV
jgi:pimeloyl-ACP methyl ester carboxylesterase